jgi:citrate synthase
MAEKALITIGDKQYELPIIIGSENEKAIDITKLREMTGYITLDNGIFKYRCMFKCDYIFRW